MSEDALKALFAAEEPASTPAPARDIGFVIAVMEKVERRRLIEGTAWWLAGGLLVTALLTLVMPYLTPVLIRFGQDIVPAVIALTGLGMVAIGWNYLAPALRDFGLPV